ncbi:MAG: hypothetical protein M3O22_01245 [Pseudomonadota bacterium]|nr:hypothetical protein [Pseudomonadota bacterium]
MTSPDISSLTGDYAWQTQFVAENAWRLLALQDRNQASPTYGCFDLGYWRDKTAEFADIRRQEAGAALGLLLHPAIQRDFGRVLPDRNELLSAFCASIAFLEKAQYPEGCFDEWYKGERGYAATEFPAVAFGLTLFLVEDIPADVRRRALKVFSRACEWLGKRVDRVKANHEAAAAAALALIGKLENNRNLLTLAAGKMQEALQRQQAEGWFPEIGGMDLGYCSVLLDYTQLYHHVTGDLSVIGPMQKLLDFMRPHICPDSTIMPESGICLNPYVSRLGMALAARHSPLAGTLHHFWLNHVTGQAGILPILAEDLRFSRWAYLPLTAWLLAPRELPAPEQPWPFYPGTGWHKDPAAGLASYHNAETDAFVSIAAGGYARIYHRRQPVLEIRPPLILSDGNAPLSLQGYHPERQAHIDNGVLILKNRLSRVAFFFPGFWQRLVLRVFCLHPASARWIRACIDHIRLRNRTAVNQSVAPLRNSAAQGESAARLSISADAITYELVLSGLPAEYSRLQNRISLMAQAGWRNPEVSAPRVFQSGSIRYRLHYSLADGIAHEEYDLS